MKAQYNNTPDMIQKLQGGTLINFNITEKTVEHPDGSHTMFECDQVNVSDNPDKGEIVSAIIRTKYSTSDELALIHNGTDTAIHTSELADFMAFRTLAKEIADNVLSQLV